MPRHLFTNTFTHTRQVLRRDVEGLPLACQSCLPERASNRAEFTAAHPSTYDDFIYVFQDLILRYEATFHRDLRLKNRTRARDTHNTTHDDKSNSSQTCTRGPFSYVDTVISIGSLTAFVFVLSTRCYSVFCWNADDEKLTLSSIPDLSVGKFTFCDDKTFICPDL